MFIIWASCSFSTSKEEVLKKIVITLFFLLCITAGSRVSPMCVDPWEFDQAFVRSVRHVIVTAYTSSADECGNSRGITASGARASDGIVACNFLPFGTKILIPDLFGDKEFVVKDRMAKRKQNYIDVWVQKKSKAFEIGKRTLAIIVLG